MQCYIYYDRHSTTGAAMIDVITINVATTNVVLTDVGCLRIFADSYRSLRKE